MSDSDKKLELVRTIREVGLAAVVAALIVFNMIPAMNRLTEKVDRLCYLVEYRMELTRGGK
jgi:hypothetical protein